MSDFELRLDPEKVRTLYYAVCEAVRYWPGSPARPPEEQERLLDLKMMLFAMTMELVLDSGEGEA
jgi:hypothetical protein